MWPLKPWNQVILSPRYFWHCIVSRGMFYFPDINIQLFSMVTDLEVIALVGFYGPNIFCFNRPLLDKQNKADAAALMLLYLGLKQMFPFRWLFSYRLQRLNWNETKFAKTRKERPSIVLRSRKRVLRDFVAERNANDFIILRSDTWLQKH